MPRRFHDAEELLPPATVFKRALAIVYDGLISIAVLLVATWIYTMIAGSLTGWDRYEQLAEAGRLSGDPGLTFVLFLVLYLFFAAYQSLYPLAVEYRKSLYLQRLLRSEE